MRREGLPLDVIGYDKAISACEKGAQWQQALSQFNEMCEKALSPTGTSYNAFISVCMKGVSEMRRECLLLGVISHNAAISACERGAQWQQAVSLFNEMCG
eukprot:12062354-Karenia_brevis.AAC.1